MGFSSPGDVFQVGDKFMLCLQTYPIKRFHWWAGDECRLWTSESTDLLHWSFPQVISQDGSKAKWTKERRQIDPFILPHEGKYWCFYKTSGQLGLLVSTDLLHWEEASPDHPIFAKDETPDHTTVENACVIKVDDEFFMYFSPCYNKRGIGLARSTDLFHWKFDRYLKFPKFAWAKSGPTAPTVIDVRKEMGKWLMGFHAERRQPHHAALGLAWSDDLINWVTTCIYPKVHLPIARWTFALCLLTIGSMSFGALLAGFLADTFRNVSWVFLATAILLWASVPFYFRVQETLKKKEKPDLEEEKVLERKS